MPTEIVKVQRPLMPPDGPWMIYGKGRKHQTLTPADAIPKHVKDAMGTDYKGYFKGAWSSVVGWGLSERVKDQDW